MIGTIATGKHYIGRFAPSPTGPLHIGSLFAALVSYLDAKHHAGIWQLRVENIDPPREVDGATDAILASLEAHGFEWSGPVSFQSDSTERFLGALDRLDQSGYTYFCSCARKRLLADGLLNAYPGICRDKSLNGGALRVRVNDHPIIFDDRWQGRQQAMLADCPGDFVLRRRDALFAYQLAVVVDDAHAGVTHIVRGIDLLDSTARQIWLQQLLDYATPDYAHFPILTDQAGAKLSKQTGAAPIDDHLAGPNLIRCLSAMGLRPEPSLDTAAPQVILQWAAERYSPDHFRHTVGSIKMPD